MQTENQQVAGSIGVCWACREFGPLDRDAASHGMCTACLQEVMEPAVPRRVLPGVACVLLMLLVVCSLFAIGGMLCR